MTVTAITAAGAPNSSSSLTPDVRARPGLSISPPLSTSTKRIARTVRLQGDIRNPIFAIATTALT
jgi:hypothetical protein